MKHIFIFLIKGYQKFISPLLGSNCRFYPTCSQYAIDALKIHGAFKGSALAAYRILRCNPFVKGGFDPVPPKLTPKRAQKAIKPATTQNSH